MAVARSGSRATAEANRIWGGCTCREVGGVYVEKGGVHVIVPFPSPSDPTSLIS